MSLARELIEKASSSNVKIAAAESCTGGMLTASLTDVPGSSAVVERGFVTYTNAAKIEMLGVSPDTLDAHGAVSEEVAGEMAKGALAASHAQIAVSITGIAGPGGSEHKPEGRVCFGLAQGSKVDTETIDFGARGRDQVRVAAREHALSLILSKL
ncbi:CinA family protein [Roseobacter sp.]|uniref:CinA family protein n=1 Tax=Roseobacter sp. TaxID=1907202 RepID=UPI003858AFB8